MATRIYVSNIEAEFFTNNTLACESSIPIKGYHKVGDIVISSVQKNDIVGWVCIVEGEPGEWQSIRNAGNWLDVKLEEINERFSRINIVNNNTNESLELLREEIEDTKKDIDANKTSINLINNDLKVIKNNIQANADDISALEEAVNDNTTDIVETNKNVTKNTTDIATLAELINDGNEANNNNLGTLSSKVQANTEAIIEINNTIETNVGEVVKIANAVKNNTQDINLLKAVDEARTGEINDINDNILELVENVETNTKAIEDLNAYHEEKEEEIANIVENVNNNIKAIEDLNDYHEEKEEELAGIVENVEVNTKAIEDLNKDVEDNKNEINEIKNALIEVLVENGEEVDENATWKDLFSQLILVNKVEIPEVISCTEITLDHSSLTFDTIGNSQTLIASVLPENCTESIIWNSTNRSVVVVDNGIVTSVGEGESIITATCGSKTDACNVVVEVNDEKITTTQSNITVDTSAGDIQLNLKEYITLEGIEFNEVTWVLQTVSEDVYLTDEGILSIPHQNEGAYVIIVSGGNTSVTITVNSYDGVEPI